MRPWIADLVHHKVLAVLAVALLVSTTVGCSALGVESIRLPDGEVKVSGLAGAILTRLSDYNSTIEGPAASPAVDTVADTPTRRSATHTSKHSARRMALGVSMLPDTNMDVYRKFRADTGRWPATWSFWNNPGA